MVSIVTHHREGRTQSPPGIAEMLVGSPHPLEGSVEAGQHDDVIRPMVTYLSLRFEVAHQTVD